jgi:hypothetical protein
VQRSCSISGKSLFRGKANENVPLKAWLQRSGIKLVPYVFSHQSGWWAQKPLDPDSDGKFSSTIWVGDDKSAGKSYVIQICAVSNVTWGKGTPELPKFRIDSNSYEVIRS